MQVPLFDEQMAAREADLVVWERDRRSKVPA